VKVLNNLWNKQIMTNSVVTNSEGSTPLIPKPAIGHDPDPVPSTSDLHNLFPLSNQRKSLAGRRGKSSGLRVAHHCRMWCLVSTWKPLKIYECDPGFQECERISRNSWHTFLISLTDILRVSVHPLHGLPEGHFPRGFPRIDLCAFSSSHTSYKCSPT
jgi:hypothetical protein